MKRNLFLSALFTMLAFTPTLAQRVNILSYNVHNCIGMDKQYDYQRIANVINQTAPDIVALQELDSATTRNKGVYALGELERLTGMHGTYAPAIPYQGGRYGIGILSKKAPLTYKTIPMPGREEERVFLIAEYKDYVFCATHQSLTPEDQLLAIPLIEKALQGIRKPIFMAGDMNSSPESVPQQQLAAHFTTLSDTASYTFPADIPDRCIDYIYGYSKNGYRFDVQHRKVVEDTIASDHRPVQVVVRIKRK